MLENLGWSETWAGRFAPYAADGCRPARVSVEHKELYQFCGAGGEGTAQVSGRLRHEARGRADFPAVGDWVALRPPADGPSVIHAVLPRTNKLSRKAAGTVAEEQVLAANLDILFLVTSLNHDLNPRRLERHLAAASLPNCRPVLVLTKADLCEQPTEVVERLRPIFPDVPVHTVSALSGEGLDELTPYLAARQTVAMLGSSGVGKSTLLNRLLGCERERVQPIREWDDRGRHTTTHRELVPLPQGGLLIDSPGLREFGLWDDSSDVDGAFTDIARLAEGCFFGDCSHRHEPRCAVLQAVAEGRLDAQRLESFHKLNREVAYLETHGDKHAERERKERARRIHRIYNKLTRRKKR